MTIVEFFDTNAVENIVSTLLCEPDRVILVGDSTKHMTAAKQRYEEIAAAHGINVTFIPQGIDRNNLVKIIEVLERVIETYGACTFDLTGGDDLYLVAVGSVFCAHRDKVQLHRFNIRNGRMYDCDADGQVLATKQTALTVDENIKAYGGRVIYDDEKPNTTFRWSFNEDFCADVRKMWDVCKDNFSEWNTVIHTLCGFYEHIQQDKASLAMCIETAAATTTLKDMGFIVSFDGGFLGKLQRAGLIHGLFFQPGKITFSFKNDQVKRALTSAGRALELYVTVVAKELTDDTGAPLFDDVMTGVTIDWDGQVSAATQDVDNEIDVLAIKDMVPLFISCKNGNRFGSDELYKLSLVAERFGGQYAQKALIATRLWEMTNCDAITNRAKEMHVRVIQKIKSEEHLRQTIQSWV